MKLVPEVEALRPQMREWRHHLHANPETAFEETKSESGYFRPTH